MGDDNLKDSKPFFKWVESQRNEQSTPDSARISPRQNVVNLSMYKLTTPNPREHYTLDEISTNLTDWLITSSGLTNRKLLATKVTHSSFNSQDKYEVGVFQHNKLVNLENTIVLPESTIRELSLALNPTVLERRVDIGNSKGLAPMPNQVYVKRNQSGLWVAYLNYGAIKK